MYVWMDVCSMSINTTNKAKVTKIMHLLMIINICVKILIVYGRKNLIICSIMQCFSPRTYTDY